MTGPGDGIHPTPGSTRPGRVRYGHIFRWQPSRRALTQSAQLAAARASTNRFDFALVGMPGLRIFETGLHPGRVHGFRNILTHEHALLPISVCGAVGSAGYMVMTILPRAWCPSMWATAWAASLRG